MELRTEHFEIDDIAIVFHAFKHTACWMRGENRLIVDRPDGSTWLWNKEHGCWTEPPPGKTALEWSGADDGGNARDGWV
jgi:hypothetical protein